MEHNIFLKKLGDQDLPNLILKTEKHLPGSLTVLGYLTFRMKYGSTETPITMVYVPENDDFPYFIAIVHLTSCNEESILLYWDSQNISDDDAMKLLKNIPNVRWENGIMLTITSCTILKKIEYFMKNFKFCGSTMEHEVYGHAMALVPKLEKMPHYELSPEFRIEMLRPEHAEKIYAHWNYKQTDSLPNLREYIRKYPSFGIFMQSEQMKTNDYQYLVSWVVAKNDGSLGYTHTLEKFRGKKLASILTQKLAKYHIMQGLTPYVLAGYHNPLAISVHKRMGCEPVEESFGWEYYRKR